MNTQWTLEKAKELFTLPFNQLIYEAHTIHRENFQPNAVQISTLLNIKTGKCPEDCAYCPQSAHYNTNIKPEPLMTIEDVIAGAKAAKDAGATRFCAGTAWRGPTDKQLATVCEMIKGIKELGMESCFTLGLLADGQAEKLKEAGLDYYNHNIDTSEEYYSKIITTRTFQDRLNTLEQVREAGLKVCCGGILGMGETNDDRINMLVTLANLEQYPESVPINQLMKVPGTPLADQDDVDPFDFIRIIALARIMMPKSVVRLSAGRENMTDEMQALCFFAGANSIFYGEKLLMTNNPLPAKDDILFNRLGLEKLSLAV